MEKVGGLSRLQRALICVVSFLLIIAVFAFFFYMPKHETINKLSKELKDAQSQLKTARAKALRLNFYRKEMAKAEAEFKVALKALPEKEEIPSLLTQISTSGQEAGLTFVLFQPQKEIARDFYAEIPVAIQVIGYYHNIGDFFGRIAAIPRIVTIRDVKLSRLKDGKLKVICTAVTYKFVEAPPKTAKKRRSRKKK